MSGSWLWGRGSPPGVVSQDCRVVGLPCHRIAVLLDPGGGSISLTVISRTVLSPWPTPSPAGPVLVRSSSRRHFHISPFSPGPAAAASHGAGTGWQLRPCYSFGDSFTSPGDSRQQASISRTVPVMA